MNKQADSVADRFRALRDRAGLSMDELAKAMGYKGASSVQRYESADYSKEVISTDLATKLLRAIVGKGTPPIEAKDIWALTRPQNNTLISSFDPDLEGEPHHDGAQSGYSREHWRPHTEGAIPEIDVKLGAGEGIVGEVINLPIGAESISAHPIVAEWRLPDDYLRVEVKASPGFSIIVEIIGDSMFPTYAPGDRVIVDLSQNRLVSDTVYAISDGFSEPQIKRLQRVPFSDPVQVRIISDNPALETFTVELERLTVIGRVVGQITRR